MFEYSPYILPLLAAALISAAVVIYTWRRRSVKGALELFVLSLAVFVWTAGSLMEIAGAGLGTKYFWGVITFIGIVFVPYGWLIFAVAYSGQERIISRRFLALTALIPSITVLLALTTKWHGLVWSEYHIVRQDNFSTLTVSHGFWFFIHSAYSYLLILIGTVLLVQVLWRRREALYRRQIVAMLIGVLAPWISNVVYLTGNSPIPYLDLTPFAFTISATAGAWAVFGFRLVDIIPIARDLVVESMRDGMIVLDAQARVVDLNTAAERIIGHKASEAIGQPAAQILSNWPGLAERYGYERSVHEEIDLGEGESRHTYDLHLSPLYDRRDRAIGQLIVGRDVTERKRAEETLARERRAFRIIAEASIHAADVPDLCHSVLTGLVETLGFEFGTVRLYYEENSLLQPTVVVGMSEAEAREKIPPQALDDPRYLAALIARTRQAVFAPDVTRHEILQTHRARLEELGIRSLIGWPIFGAEQSLLGVIQLFARTPREIVEEDRTFFETVAGMFATVLERKQAEEALGWRATQLSTLNRIGRHVASILDRQELLQRAVNAVREDLDPLSCN